LAREKFDLLQSDPRHPSLHFKRVGKLWRAYPPARDRHTRTGDGERAKTFVEAALEGLELIGITTKPDAYDRYIADIFIPNENDHGQQIVDRGRYLNQMLVDEGLARRVEY
jgi:hypothetical protein